MNINNNLQCRKGQKLLLFPQALIIIMIFMDMLDSYRIDNYCYVYKEFFVTFDVVI